MRIMDNNNMSTLDTVLLLLTQAEADELASKIKSIDPSTGDHIHVNDLDGQREITVAIYTDDNLSFFSDEVQSEIG